MIFGAHCSTSGGVWKALERAESITASSCQIFVKNNMQWFGKPYLPDDLRHYANQRALHPGISVFGHSGYLINLGAPASENRDKSVKSLVQELRLACDLGLPFLVLHPGAHLGSGEDQGLKQVIAGLDEVFNATREIPVRVALENTAGQGSCLGGRIEHLARIYDGVQSPARLGLCLDTAHFFESGYDIRLPAGWKSAVKEVDDLIGQDQILAFHLNDSKTPLGSRVDRHAGIGQGQIGLEAFRHIVNDSRFKNLPGCLETPKSADLHEDVENLTLLRSLTLKNGVNKKKGRSPLLKQCDGPPS